MSWSVRLIEGWLDATNYADKIRFLATHPEIVSSETPDVLRALIQQTPPRERNDLYLCQEIIRYLTQRGVTSASILDAYTNVYGGTARGLPSWLRTLAHQALDAQGTATEGARKRAEIWQQAVKHPRASSLHPTIIAATLMQLSAALNDIDDEDRFDYLERRIQALETDDLLITLLHVLSKDGSERVIGGYLHAQDGAMIIDLLHLWQGETIQQKLAALEQVEGSSLPLVQAVHLALGQLKNQRLATAPLSEIDGNELAILSHLINFSFLKLEIERCQGVLAETVLRPVAEWLESHRAKSVTLIPCGNLAAFPLLATALEPSSTAVQTFGDYVPASIAPSALSLLHGEQILPRAGVATLGNPMPSISSLPWSEAEAVALAVLGGHRDQAKIGYAATREWFTEQIRRVKVLGASCHGISTGENVLEYRLSLAHRKSVTLQDALTGIAELHGLRLLILSACQTGIIYLRGASSEMRSLSVGFLQAGASAVIGALWPVDDRATYLLMVRFAQLWFPVMDTQPPATVLAQAQAWLRTRTWADLADWTAFEVVNPTPEEGRGVMGDVDSRLATQKQLVQGNPELTRATTDSLAYFRTGRGNWLEPPHLEAEQLVHATAVRQVDQSACPYADPIYWAAFHITGW